MRALRSPIVQEDGASICKPASHKRPSKLQCLHTAKCDFEEHSPECLSSTATGMAFISEPSGCRSFVKETPHTNREIRITFTQLAAACHCLDQLQGAAPQHLLKALYQSATRHGSEQSVSRLALTCLGVQEQIKLVDVTQVLLQGTAPCSLLGAREVRKALTYSAICLRHRRRRASGLSQGWGY